MRQNTPPARPMTLRPHAILIGVAVSYLLQVGGDTSPPHRESFETPERSSAVTSASCQSSSSARSSSGATCQVASQVSPGSSMASP